MVTFFLLICVVRINLLGDGTSFLHLAKGCTGPLREQYLSDTATFGSNIYHLTPKIENLSPVNSSLSIFCP